MKGFPVRPVPVESVGEAAKAVARRQAEQLTLVRRRAQPTAVYIVRLTATAVFAYLLALRLPGGSSHSVLAPLTALLVAQATLFHTIGSAIRRVAAVTAGVLAAVAVAAYVPFSWWVLGLLIAGTLALGIVLRLRDEILEVPISAMLIFSVDSHAAATSRITETLVGAAAGLAAGLLFAPLRVQPAKNAVGELSRQMADLLAQMADGLAETPDPRRAAEWLDRTRALRGEIERVDDALAQAEESVRMNPRRLRFGDPAAGLREGVDTLERAATDMRVLARSVADSARIDSDHSPVREAETRARLAAVIAELSAAVRAYGQLLEADPVSADFSAAAAAAAAEPITEALEDHLEEAQRQQDQLADLLSTDPADRPEGWQLRGEILAHVDRLRSELEPGRLPDPARPKPPLRALRDRTRSDMHRSDRHNGERHHGERHHGERHRESESLTGPRRQPNRPALRVRARRTALRVSGVSRVSGVRARRARLSARRALLGTADHRPGAFQVLPQALGPPGRARLAERSRQVRRGGRAVRGGTRHDQVEWLLVEPGGRAAPGQEGAYLADGRGIRLGRRPAVVGQQDRRRAVPPGGTAHRPTGRPDATDPYRYPRALHWRRQEHHILDAHVVAAEGHRLPRPEQVQRLKALVQPGGQFLLVGGLAEAAKLVRDGRAQPGSQDNPAAGEPVQGGYLPGQLGYPAARYRRDHRAQPDGPRSQRGGRQQHPRIRDSAPKFLPVGDVIPHEQPVPARILGPPG